MKITAARTSKAENTSSLEGKLPAAALGKGFSAPDTLTFIPLSQWLGTLQPKNTGSISIVNVTMKKLSSTVPSISVAPLKSQL